MLDSKLCKIGIDHSNMYPVKHIQLINYINWMCEKSNRTMQNSLDNLDFLGESASTCWNLIYIRYQRALLSLRSCSRISIIENSNYMLAWKFWYLKDLLFSTSFIRGSSRRRETVSTSVILPCSWLDYLMFE